MELRLLQMRCCERTGLAAADADPETATAAVRTSLYRLELAGRPGVEAGRAEDQEVAAGGQSTKGEVLEKGSTTIIHR